jgi:hypothetical protein
MDMHLDLSMSVSPSFSLFQNVVSHVALKCKYKVFDLESIYFTGMLISKLSGWAPGVSHVDYFSFVRLIALDLVKVCNI